MVSLCGYLESKLLNKSPAFASLWQGRGIPAVPEDTGLRFGYGHWAAWGVKGIAKQFRVEGVSEHPKP